MLAIKEGTEAHGDLSEQLGGSLSKLCKVSTTGPIHSADNKRNVVAMQPGDIGK